MENQEKEVTREFPPVEECVRIIAEVLCVPVKAAAASLEAQARELNLSKEGTMDLVHTQYLSAIKIKEGR